MPIGGEQLPMRIAWLLPPPLVGSGGFSNIFRIINLLSTFGHENIVYINPYGLPAEYQSDLGRYVRRFFGPIFAPVYPWPETIEQVDIALATQWSTFYLLDRCAPDVARGYFVQDWEPFFYAMGDDYLKAEETYRGDVPCITLGHWLGEFLHEKYGATTYPFDFAVEHERYYPRPELRPQKHPRIIYYARPSTPRRCFTLGAKALEIVHKRYPKAEIVLFGDHNLSLLPLPFPFKDKGILDHEQLAELYASATVGVVLSPTNPSLMPPELMASQCAVVDLDLAPNHFLVQHEQTGLLVTPKPEPLADAICRLLEDHSLRERLITNAEAHVSQFSWEHSARQIEAALHSIAPQRVKSTQEARLDLEHRDGDGVTPRLSPRLTVGQRCIPRHDGLCRVAVAIKTTANETPILSVYDTITPEQPVLKTTAGRLEDGWLVYDFNPLPTTRHQPLYFTLSATHGPQVCFDYRPTGGGSLAYNHVPQTGQLVFRTFYRPVLGQSRNSRDPLRAELDYLHACRSLAAEEQQLLTTYTSTLGEPTPPVASWAQRGSRAAALVRQGDIGRLAQEGWTYLRWIRARLMRGR